jgi:hypothetical protein
LLHHSCNRWCNSNIWNKPCTCTCHMERFRNLLMTSRETMTSRGQNLLTGTLHIVRYLVHGRFQIPLQFFLLTFCHVASYWADICRMYGSARSHVS